MTKRSQFRNPGNHIHAEAIPDDSRTEAETWIDFEVSRLRLLVNDELSVGNSFRFVKELTDATDRIERLAIVRGWAISVGLDPRCSEAVRKQEIADTLTQKRAALTKLEAATASHQFYFALLDKLKGDIYDLEQELIQ